MRIIKFIRFKNSAGLQKVQNSVSFCVLFFLKSTLILNKHSLKKLKEIHQCYDNCLETNYSLIFFSKQKNKIIRYSIHDSNEQIFETPPDNKLLQLKGCSTKKYLIATSQNTKLGSFSILFWGLSSSKLMYVLDEEQQPEGIQMLDQTRLLLFTKNRLKVFDTSSMKFSTNIKLEGRIKEVQLIRNSLLLLILQDESHFTINLVSKEIAHLSYSDSSQILIYLKELSLLLDSTDIKNIKKIEL